MTMILVTNGSPSGDHLCSKTVIDNLLDLASLSINLFESFLLEKKQLMKVGQEGNISICFFEKSLVNLDFSWGIRAM